MQINVISAGIVGGELVIGLADGSLIRAGMVQGTQGPKGDPGPPGPKGDDGADGNTIWNGEGPPRPELGKPGDLYLQVEATAIWGPKEPSGRWPGPVYLLSEAARRDRAGGPMQRGRQGGPSAFFGGTGPTAAAQAQPTQGLKPILINNNPLPATTATKIAEDARGELFDVHLRVYDAAGVWSGSIRVSRFGNQADHTVWGEILQGTAPVLTFTPAVVGGALTLSMSSATALTKVLGVQVILEI